MLGGEFRITSIVTHKNIIIAAYVLEAAYSGVWVVRQFDSIVATNAMFFDASTFLAHAATALIIAAPVSCVLLAFLVLKEHRWPIMVLPAILVSVVLIPYGLLISLYLAWWYYTRVRVRIS